MKTENSTIKIVAYYKYHFEEGVGHLQSQKKNNVKITLSAEILYLIITVILAHFI